MNQKLLFQFDYKRAKEFFILALITVAYYLWFQGFYNKIAYGRVIPYETFDVALSNVIHNFIPIALIFLLNYLSVFVFTKTLKRTSLKIIVDVAASLTILAIVNLGYMLVLKYPIVDWAGTLFNNTFIFLGVEAVYYIKNYQRSVIEKESKHRQMIQYQYDALRAQVNPHFLFNSLNILYSLIDIDVDKSRSFVMSLSKMYRYIMQQHGNDKVALADELAFLSAYVDVLKMRFHNCFELDIEGEDNVGEHKVIPYCMQLLMENVIKHNVIQSNLPMIVTVLITDSHVSMSNPIHPKRAKTSIGIGLQYITELYSHHNKKFSYKNDGITFTATIPYLK